MKLNLTIEGRLTTGQAKRINEIEPTVRAEYEKFIGDLTSVNSFKNIDWLLEVSCRNTFASNLHQKMCKLALLEDLIDHGELIEEVKVDSISMKTAVASLLSNKNIEGFISVHSKGNFRILKIAYNIVVSLYLAFNEWLWTTIITSRNQPKGEIILIENFLFLDSFDQNYKLNDRNYPGFFDYCRKDQKEQTWYLSILNGIKHPREWISMLNNIKQSDSQIIIKEDYLSIKDYFSAFYHSLLIPQKVKKCPKWRAINISDLVLDEAKDEIGAYSLVSSILYYKFFGRLKDTGIKLDLVIDWHENQTIDRALNLGINKFFPSTKTKGYQGFIVSEFYSSLTPTLYEKENGLLPDEIFVISESLVKQRRKYCNDIKVSLAPAFRYMETIKHQSKPTTKTQRSILVALPMLYSESKQVLDMVLSAQLGEDTTIIVKCHPTVLMKNLLLNVKAARDLRLKFTNRKLADLLDECTLFVTMTSSAAIESTICNTYVAIVANITGPSANPIENIVEQKYWRLCYTPDCIKEAFQYSLNNEILNTKDYLVPLNHETFSAFIS